MLRPLEQWICDSCGEVIHKPEEGWVEWVEGSDNLCRDFRICHHKVYSPFENQDGCYKHSSELGRCDLHLDQILGEYLMPFLLKFLGGAQLHEYEPRESRIGDMTSFVDFSRRLTIPHYEQARQYWDAAYSEGQFADLTSEQVYTQYNLLDIIEKYGSGEPQGRRG